jgi:hypothetical protein
VLQDIMYALNYFAIGWIGLVFFFIFLRVIFRAKIKRSNFKVSICITILAFAIFAFNYEPTIYTDLYRHYEVLNLIRNNVMSFYYSYELITSFLFEIVAKTQYNQLLPFIVTIIRYSLFFIIIYLYVKSYQIGSYYINLFLFFHFAFLPLIESISGVRYYFAITVLGYGLIYEFFIKRNLVNKISIISPLLIHTASSMYLALRVLVSNKLYKIIKPFRFILLFWSLFYIQISELLQTIGLTYTDTASNLLTYYVEEDRAISLNLTIARSIMVILIYIMFFVIKKNDKENYIKNHKYYSFIELVLLFTIGSIFIDVFFQRNVFFIALICMPLFFNFFNSSSVSNKTKNIFIILILILSIGMYLNQIYGLIFGYF